MNSVKPKKTARVMSLEICSYFAQCDYSVHGAHKACSTILLLKKATTTPSVNASISVKVESKKKFKGWLWRFQYNNPRLMRVPRRGT